MERRKFTREFKLEAVRLIKERGVSYAQAEQDLDVHQSAAMPWRSRTPPPDRWLMHPLFLCGLIYEVLGEAPMWKSGGATVAILYGMTLTIGYVTSALLGWLGLARRGLLSTAWVLVFTPLHWLLLSLAAWRALCQLVISPYRWEKTEHGLAKSSRRARRLTHALLQLERLLRSLKETGNLAALPAEPTYTSATRRPIPRAAA